MSIYLCQRCNHKFTASNPTQCPSCTRTSTVLSTYRTQDDIDFWTTTFFLLAATDDSPTNSYSNNYSSYDSDSNSYSDSSSSSSD